jgi:hypothetical protein
VDLVSRDSIRVSQVLQTTESPRIYVLFTPTDTG